MPIPPVRVMGKRGSKITGVTERRTELTLLVRIDSKAIVGCMDVPKYLVHVFVQNHYLQSNVNQKLGTGGYIGRERGIAT
jgi:hypothetical protein